MWDERLEPWQKNDQRWRERQPPPEGKTWMCIPLPDEPIDENGHPIEYRECSHCFRGFWIRVRAANYFCSRLACSLERDRQERHAQMTPAELAIYYKCAEDYFAPKEGHTDKSAPRDKQSGLRLAGLKAPP